MALTRANTKRTRRDSNPNPLIRGSRERSLAVRRGLLSGAARAQVPERLASCSRVAVNVAVKCERKVSREVGEAGVPINLVYLEPARGWCSARMTSPQQRQRLRSSQCPRDRASDQTGSVRRVVLFASVVVAVVLFMVLFSWAFQRRLIYLPSTGAAPPAATMLAAGRDVQLTTSDGLMLGAWYIPARGAADTFTVLVANGNAGDRSLRAPLARALANQGFGVLLFDYRGYGGNPGSPSEEGLARDVRAAHRFLTDEGVPGERLLYYGESLGAAVVAELATEHPPAGLVLRSPFTDLASVGQIHYPFLPVRALLKDRYPVAEYVARVTVPITVVYGTKDTIVPPEESRRSVAGAHGPIRLVAVEGVEHNDPALLNGNALMQAVMELANEINRNP